VQVNTTIVVIRVLPFFLHFLFFSSDVFCHPLHPQLSLGFTDLPYSTHLFHPPVRSLDSILTMPLNLRPKLLLLHESGAKLYHS
jgi:hypothetical protein